MNGPTRNGHRDVNRQHAGQHAAGDRRGKAPPDGTSSNDGGSKAGRARRMSGSAAVEYAKAHLADLTGLPCEAVSSLNRSREGWRVVLEVVELERIPRTTDILASYAVELDEEGELMGYERIHRYYRNDVNGDS